ncbi:hypothetical protein T492DRAFT_914551 [Pavlovales sp. CCMP2436]|nr:hypothetical protein T492DRAFT_914551 [Pavlovales sp. CCMP2436]
MGSGASTAPCVPSSVTLVTSSVTLVEFDPALDLLTAGSGEPQPDLATVLKATILLKRRLEAKKVADRRKYNKSGLSVTPASSSAAKGIKALKVAVPREASIKAGLKLLEERLRFCGLREAQIQGDGNCQFRSLSYQLFGTQRHHAYVREKACQHMRIARREYEVFMGSPAEFDEWLGQMETPSKWGDELTLRAAADAFRCAIHVIQSTPENWHLVYTPSAGEPVRRLFVTYVAPIHYNSITRQFRLASERGGTPPESPSATPAPVGLVSVAVM